MISAIGVLTGILFILDEDAANGIETILIALGLSTLRAGVKKGAET